MRKLALSTLAWALGIALTGSISKADFAFTQSRVSGPTTDTVTFFLQVTNSGTNAGYPFVLGINVAIFDYTNASGLIVTSNNAGQVNGYSGTGTRLFANLTDGTSTLFPIQSNPNVLNPSGSVTYSGAVGSTPYATNSSFGVQGLGVAVGDITGEGIDMSSGPIPIAQAIVNHNDTVMLLQPTPAGEIHGNRQIFPAFEPSATDILVTTRGTGLNNAAVDIAPTSAFVSAVPEPTSLSLFSLASAGLLARRRSI